MTLKILREQLQIMDEFMAATNDGVPHRDSLWWSGDLPADPDLYSPADWQTVNKPVYMIWDEYLYELEKLGLTDTLRRAQELPIADLLAASRKAEKEAIA